MPTVISACSGTDCRPARCSRRARRRLAPSATRWHLRSAMDGDRQARRGRTRGRYQVIGAVSSYPSVSSGAVTRSPRSSSCPGPRAGRAPRGCGAGAGRTADRDRRARAASSGPRTGHVHFLIPGAPGGGWDGTARGVGEALVRSGLARSASYENLSGGGGGRALAHFIATADRQQDTLLISSTPIVIASLRGRLPHSWRDVDAGGVGDRRLPHVRGARRLADPELERRHRRVPAAIRRRCRSRAGPCSAAWTIWSPRSRSRPPASIHCSSATCPTTPAARRARRSSPARRPCSPPAWARSSTRAAAAWCASSASPRAARLPEATDVPTLAELGAGVEFVNWRGFFAPPGTTDERGRGLDRAAARDARDPRVGGGAAAQRLGRDLPPGRRVRRRSSASRSGTWRS